MSFYYFINCIALIFVPLFFVYKFTLLSEYGSIYRCSFALFAYIITQIIKLLIMATLSVPAFLFDQAIDCLGLYYVLMKQQKASLAQVKILGVAVGWSFGESLLTRVIDLYVNARSMQFDWRHIISAMEANITLIQSICACTLIWNWSRGSNKVPLIVLIAYFIGQSLIGSSFMLKACLVSIFAVSTLIVSS
ncbi:transmembrane protein 147-like [Panonychus citri]|uniref:transmembrane protein 147-like n=1 Tax=Panonychus citri TaxID=50023 RepID=UPI0023072E49|nr:transmembrane protein 147-like [Panonychus citri]